MLNKNDRELLLQLVNQSAFNGSVAEVVVGIKAKLSQDDAPSPEDWERACRNLLSTEDFQRIADAATANQHNA